VPTGYNPIFHSISEDDETMCTVVVVVVTRPYIETDPCICLQDQSSLSVINFWDIVINIS